MKEGLFGKLPKEFSTIDGLRKKEVLNPRRITGELQKKHKGLEPLPLTPVTDHAQLQLEEWGVSPKEVKQLRKITSLLRYDLCEEKSLRITKNGGEIYKEDDGTEVVVLPDFFNFTDRLDGQCGDLSAQGQHLLTETNFLPKINERLTKQGKHPLTTCYVSGLSQTHFNQEGRNHFWIGLRPEGAADESTIIIDPSFQTIMTTEESGYTPQEYRDEFHPFALKNYAEIPLGEYSTEQETYIFLRPPTIGISTDKDVAYNLGFVKNKETAEIFPVIQTILAHEEKAPIGYPTTDGTVQFEQGELLTEGQRREIGTIIDTIKTMPLRKASEKPRLPISDDDFPEVIEDDNWW